MNAQIAKYRVVSSELAGNYYQDLVLPTGNPSSVTLDVDCCGDGQKALGDICCALGTYVSELIGVDGFVERINLECTAYPNEYIATATYTSSRTGQRERYVARIAR